MWWPRARRVPQITHDRFGTKHATVIYWVDLDQRFLSAPAYGSASASPLTIDVDNIRRIEGAAVVLPSLFEEQIEQEAKSFEPYTKTEPGGLRRSAFVLAFRGEL
jgi:hypothetical protein